MQQTLDSDIRFRTEKSDCRVIVTFEQSRMMDEAALKRLTATLQAEGGDRTFLVCDFSQVEHLASAALQMLIQLDKTMQEQGGALLLCGFCNDIYEVFKVTRLNKTLSIYGTRSEAVSAIPSFEGGDITIGASTPR